MKSHSQLTGVAMAVALALSACAGARPYEREYLSSRGMQIGQPADVTKLEQHVFEYREGSAGAYGARGGGCGCN